MRRRRVRTWAKWACTLAALLAVGVAVASRLRWVRCTIVTHAGTTVSFIEVGHGLVWTGSTEGVPPESIIAAPGWETGHANTWYWGLAGELPNYMRQVPWHHGLLWRSVAGEWELGFSLLYPVLLTTIPAAFLWYKDRRRSSPHTCPNCNYDRRGLPAQAKCPECGTVPARG
jgi:hypothetical protein